MKKIISIIVASAFLFSNLYTPYCSADNFEQNSDCLAPSPKIFQNTDFSKVLGDDLYSKVQGSKAAVSMLMTMIAVAKAHNESKDYRSIAKELTKTFNDSNSWGFLENDTLDVIFIGTPIFGVSKANFFTKINDKYIIFSVSGTEPKIGQDEMIWEKVGTHWVGVGNPKLKPLNLEPIGYVESPGVHGKDLKGANASEADPLVRELIKNNNVVEIFCDTEDENIRARRVRFIDEYQPMAFGANEYLGEELDIDQFFLPGKIQQLKKIMLDNKVRGEPVKFRMVMGKYFVGENEDLTKVNVAHAGVRDKAVYIGSILLKLMLDQKDGSLIDSILVNDEFKHIQGAPHAPNEEARINEAAELLDANQIDMLRDAMLVDNPNVNAYDLKILFENLIKENKQEKLLSALYLLNDIAMSQNLYPVERTTPIKHAVSLLDKREQKKLIAVLKSEKAEEYRNLIVVDEILLMLDEAYDFKNWIKRFASELKGRTLWQISPEIWHEAGGLARVMQYHGAEIKKLLKDSNTSLKHVEPHYQNRINANGVAEKLDYTSDSLTYPLRNSKGEKKLEEVTRFKVKMGNKYIDTVVSKGINELGIEVYLIRDIQQDGSSFFVHSLYNYNNPNDKGNDEKWDKARPTWEEFSVYYSKAALQFVKWQEADEKLKKGKDWKGPVLHLNDSQVALISAYRQIELDIEIKNKINDPTYQIDPVLDDMVIAMTTHTYRNRKSYGLANNLWDRRNSGDRAEGETNFFNYIYDKYGFNKDKFKDDPRAKYGRVADLMMAFMEIPDSYKEVFRHTEYGNEVFDIASGGLRFADWQGAVARAHADDVRIYDEWINNPLDRGLEKYYTERGLGAEIIAVSNGDHRVATAEFFRQALGKNADHEQPTPEEVQKAKIISKEKLNLPLDDATPREVYSSKDGIIKDGRSFLDKDQIVISYSGRLVEEKVGVKRSIYDVESYDKQKGYRAFTDENIEKMVASGMQVVIYGNVQTNNEESAEMKKGFIALAEKLGKQGLPGRFIFVPRFKLEDQRRLLAATDVVVLDSHPQTEAAGFTEVDGAVCGALVVPTKRDDNKVGEGLFQAQGMPMDLTVPGKGNTMVPEKRTEGAYLETLMKLKELYDNDKIKEYQATSVRLSRALEAKFTSAAYLREFSRAVKIREERKRWMNIKRSNDERKDFLRDTVISDPVKYDAYKISDQVLNGEVSLAVEIFVTSTFFQAKEKTYEMPVMMFNRLLSLFKERRITEEKFLEFSRAFVDGVLLRAGEETPVNSGIDKYVQSLQVISGQAVTLMTWISRNIEGAKDIWLTANESKMARSNKEAGGLSFMIFPEGIEIAPMDGEGREGYFWRGSEPIAKMQNDINPEMVNENDKNQHETFARRTSLYVMNHGFLKVPNALNVLTNPNRIADKGLVKVSTIHETIFINDKVPFSNQCTSTGAGHFQANNLDIKQVSAGIGIQFNVKYASDGTIEKVYCHKLKEGDYALALPGCVDYVVNLGGLRFNDFSVALAGDLMEKYGLAYDEAVVTMLDGKKKTLSAPVQIMKQGDEIEFVLNGTTQDKLVWIGNSQGAAPSMDILNFYEGLNPEKINSYLDDIFETGFMEVNPPIAEADENILVEPVDRSNVKGSIYIDGYAEDNADLLQQITDGETGDKLVRIAIEDIDLAAVEMLNEMQKNNIYIELFSNLDPNVSVSAENVKGLTARELPESLLAQNRSKANTITLMSVYKGEKLPVSGKVNARWQKAMGAQELDKTIVTPIGHNYDRAGLIRSVLFGLRLTEIARNNYDATSPFVEYTLAQYMDLCRGTSVDMHKFKLTREDILSLALGDSKTMIEALNKIIEFLPIVPLGEEVRDRYDRIVTILRNA
ncbi:MAG: hypothetical protein HQL29_05270 [Candidatus Omnitrophica bacterium]|nr:hypothetical protein [Candidatus Omnitrophota bacterium]